MATTRRVEIERHRLVLAAERITKTLEWAKADSNRYVNAGVAGPLREAARNLLEAMENLDDYAKLISDEEGR